MIDNCLEYNGPSDDGFHSDEAKSYCKYAERFGSKWDESVHPKAMKGLFMSRQTPAVIENTNEISGSRKRSVNGSSIKRVSKKSKASKSKCAPKKPTNSSKDQGIPTYFVNDRQLCSHVNSAEAGKIGNGKMKSFTTGGNPEVNMIILSIRRSDFYLTSLSLKCTFFSKYFRDRVLMRTEDLNNNPVIEKTVNHNGYTYELAACKMKDRESFRLGFRGKKEMTAKFLYIAVGGPDMPEINLQSELESIADFGSLGAKTLSRLELGLSEAKLIESISISDIIFVKECGNEGCGFFPFGCFDGCKELKGCNVVQIRIIGPKIGVIKGLLCAKLGIKHIQIPESMLKVQCSRVGKELANENDDLAAFVFKRSVPSKTNQNFDRVLDSEKDDPPPSYLDDQTKALSKMYIRMLMGFGIPKTYCECYVRKAKDPKKRKHATLMGVADPTGHIPYGSVFIPGCK
jgi:hypothetical protein